MPVYEYIERRTGRRVEIVQPVHRRDQVPGYDRITVPRRLHVVLGAPDPGAADCSVPRAFKELEQTLDHRQIARESGWSTEQVKSIWNLNNATRT